MTNENTAIENKPVIHLISQTNWEYEELSQAKNFNVKRNYGLDVPLYNKFDIWRIPQEPYTHFMLSGAKIPVEAPGPLWLDSVPKELTKRSVVTLTVSEVLNMVKDPHAFWKFAEAKNSNFIAQSYSLEYVKEYLIKNDIPHESFMQFSDIFTINNEYRFFVIDKNVVTGSLYLHRNTEGHEITIYDGAIVNTEEYFSALHFLQEVLPSLDTPKSLVIDVAKTNDGFAILEANPSWCSGWYDCNIDLVAEAIKVSNLANMGSKWLYQPDMLLIRKYERQRPLENRNFN
jgi:hypothetical protein